MTMRLSKATRMFKRLIKGEAGVLFLETVIALAVLSVIAVTFLSGLYTTSRAVIVADKQANAASIARSQMEWVKKADYVYETDNYTTAPLPVGDEYANYSANITAQPVNSPDDGIQEIEITVKYYDEEVATLKGYKVDR